jgi:hypothetical protein
VRKNGYYFLLLSLALPLLAARSARANATEYQAQLPSSRSVGWQPYRFWRSGIFYIDPVVAVAIARSTFERACGPRGALPPWQRVATDTGKCSLGRHGTSESETTTVGQTDDSEVAPGFAMGFGAGYAMPTLLHYTGTTKSRPDLALSFSPGGPCIGACLKLAGSF